MPSGRRAARAMTGTPTKAVTTRATSKGATTYGRQDYGGGAATRYTESPRVRIRFSGWQVRQRPPAETTTTANQALRTTVSQRPVATAVTGRAAIGSAERRLRCSSTTAADALTSSQHQRSRTGRPVPAARHRCVTPSQEIRWDGRVALLADLNSATAPLLTMPVQEWRLADGDAIRPGHSEIIVRMH